MAASAADATPTRCAMLPSARPHRDALRLDQAQHVVRVEAARAQTVLPPLASISRPRPRRGPRAWKSGTVSRLHSGGRHGGRLPPRAAASISSRAVSCPTLIEAADAAVRVDGALRTPGRAARVEDDGGVVLRDLGRREARRAPLAQERGELGDSISIARHDPRPRRARPCAPARAVGDQTRWARCRRAVQDLGRRPTSRSAPRRRRRALTRRPEGDRSTRGSSRRGSRRGRPADAVLVAQHARRTPRRARGAPRR